MKTTILLIRSGMTCWGLENRQAGLSGEGLLEEEKRRLYARAQGGAYPAVRLAYVSPLLRSRETVSLLFPRTPAVIVNDLRAIDAGAFQGKTYGEMAADPRFSPWAGSLQTGPIPGGEDLHQFHIRNAQAFLALTREMQAKDIESAAVLTHHLNVSAILQRFCIPRSNYRDWHVHWGNGYVIEFDHETSAATVRANL